MMTNAKFLLYTLAAALFADLAIPFALAPFYKGYSHLTKVMSVLGNHGFGLHMIYNTWLILLGILILLGNTRLYPVIEPASKPLAVVFTFITTSYAFGGCILSGLFSVNDSKTLDTLSAKIHGFGSVIGFMILLFAALTLAIYFYKTGSPVCAVISGICFVSALFFFTLFVMADKPSFSNTIVSYEGLWQRLSLLSMYAPIVILCIKSAGGIE